MAQEKIHWHFNVRIEFINYCQHYQMQFASRTTKNCLAKKIKHRTSN